ncbi:MAG: FMN-binding glutamate synthase family protein [Candidatus Binatia bacterium]
MWILALLLLVVIALAVYDVVQRPHAILHNFPILGHFRYWLETIGPELRQYIVTSNDEERPFSRDQRRWVYSAAKRENTYFGFGSDNEMDAVDNYVIVKHGAFPLDEPVGDGPGTTPQWEIPCAKVLGEPRGRAKAWRPQSVVGVSGMSFGALGAGAVEALNRGCAEAHCWQNTGEGGVSPHHLHGGDLIWQIGTGYFGCREENGRFCLERLVETAERHDSIRAIEIKLSQGAKPGLGGILPAAKVSAEIARTRGVPQGKDCLSPPRHSAFADADQLLDFVERIAEATGLPVGVKSAVGDHTFWEDLARLMAGGTRAVDFITIDGGEGGTGAGPLAFLDHVALPFRHAFSRVYRALAEHDVHDRIVLVGSGKLGFPERALVAFALGCDMIAVAREPMLAIGCIQAQRCHTGHCPAGITTHNRWLERGLDPELKAERLAGYVTTLRRELLRLSRACGVPHPGMVGPDQLEILDGHYRARTLSEVFEHGSEASDLAATQRDAITRIMLGYD